MPSNPKPAAKTTKAVKGAVVKKRPAAKAAPAKKAPVKTAPLKKTASAPAKKAAKPAAKPAQTPAKQSVTMRGRSVFVVQTTAKGVVVRSAWLSEDKTLREMPAVFPELDYALAVVDDLRKQIVQHFSQAAKVGARAIASQRQRR